MKVVLLGAHNVESNKTKLAGVLVNDEVAFDAGSIVSSLSIPQQLKIKAVAITHAHYDHVKDLPLFGMNLSLNECSAEVYAPEEAVKVITNNLFSGVMYPDFYNEPEGAPVFKVKKVKPYEQMEINGYKIKAIPVKHGVPAVGYLLVSRRGKSLFYTGDTGQSLSECWEHASPDLLVIEVTMPNRHEEKCIKTGHLCPSLLKRELEVFKQKKGYIPQVICVHIDPCFEDEIEEEVDSVAKELGASIALGYEGMRVNL